MTAVREWLESLELGEYNDAFAENAVDFEVLADLSDADLEKIGVRLGHRRKLLKAIAALDQVSSPPATREAERRQITVMFCDLVGSTALSEALDPEDLRTLMQAYQQACRGVVERYEGHVAQYLGDGLMTYFGWPQAHEDDAERAVRAGLEIIEAIKTVSAPKPLRARVGIATGPVVVGETGAGDASVPKLAVGETPNLAARFQSLAGADEVLIAASTRRLLADTVIAEDLGERALKGIVEPVRAFRIRGLAAAEGRFAAAHGTRLTPFVGRDAEMVMLEDKWQQAKEGEGQLVLLCGEPGIGKSRIIQELRERVRTEGAATFLYQCSPFHTNTAFYPISETIARVAGFSADDDATAKLDKIDTHLRQIGLSVDEAAPLVAGALSIPTGERYPPLEMSPQKQKQRTVEALAEAMTASADQIPVLFLVEDMHWCDPSSLETATRIVELLGQKRILAVFTYRPEFAPPWSGLGNLTPLTLSRLRRTKVGELIAKVTGGKPLPEEVAAEIVAKTDGVPLFVEELTKTVLESGIVEEGEDSWRLAGDFSGLAIPATLHDSLMARLDRLAPVKEVAQTGACIGREFSHALLAAISPLNGNALQDALQQLVDSELIFSRGVGPDATYTFKHALVQDAAYESLLKSRRQQLHAKLAGVLLETPDIAETMPELLGHHYTRADLPQQAVQYWVAAGQRATAGASAGEAAEHFKAGLPLVQSLGDDEERADIELRLQSGLGFSLVVTKGYADAEVHKVFGRVEELLEAGESGPELCPTLYAMAYYDWTTGNTHKGLEKFEHILEIAQAHRDPDIELVARQGISSISLNRAEYSRAIEESERVIGAYDTDRHAPLRFTYGQDIYAAAASFVSGVHTHLGQFEKGIARAEAAVAHARTLDHPFSLAHALAMGGFGLSTTGIERNVLAWSNEVIALHDAQVLPFWGAWGYLNRGCLARFQGRSKEAIADLEQGMAILESSGGTGGKPAPLYEMALAYTDTGQLDLAEARIKESEDMIESSGEYLGRTLNLLARGRLCVATDGPQADSARQCFEAALAMARRQSEKVEELRAATLLERVVTNRIQDSQEC